jgi:hypothetical protein
VFDGVAHLASVERPAAFASLLRRFLLA